MKGNFLSSDWYRVAGLKPRLRSHVEIHRQVIRGAVWYIVQDAHSGKYHRVGPAANYLLGMMNGRRSVEALWEAACDRFPDDPPTQPEVIHLLSQLHASDLIAGDMAPDLEELGRRHYERTRKSLIARIRNPLAMRFPLLDPDAFLNATMGLFRPVFTVWGFLVWLALVLTGVTLAAMNWGPLTEDIADKVLSAQNIALIALAYPLVKAIHEMGHAYAAKVWGGEVHEIGAMLLVLIPVPYVDASASAAFPEKWRRAVVGGAGIMVELALAALAMIFWVNAEPGLARAFAFNVMLIGGVSTLLFNGNPLLRFDGYFVLTDILEIPNLGARSTKYFWYLVQRYLFGIRDIDSPVTGRGERVWLFTYAVAAFCYRMLISIAISLFIASKLFFIGIILAIWALSNVFVFPLFKGLKFLFTSRALRERRGRAVGLSGLIVALVVWVAFFLPLPYATMAQGVVVPEDSQIVRAETGGFVSETLLALGPVMPGETVVRIAERNLDSQAALTALRKQELQLRLERVTARDPIQTSSLREQMVFIDKRLESLDLRRAALDIRSERAGQVVIPGAEDLDGRLINEGSILGYVITDDALRLRVGVPQGQAELVRGRSLSVSVAFRHAPFDPVPARIVSAAPEGQRILPAPGLSTEAGGPFALDPSDPQRRRTLRSVFVFDLIVDDPPAQRYVGERVLVRFDHGPEPVATRIYRGLRQLFLRQFSV